MAKKTTRIDGPTGLELLKQDLKSGQFGRLYLFCGEEAYLRDHYLQALQDKLLDGPARDFNYHRFTPETMGLQAFSDALDALPMLAQRTLIQVEDCDLSRLGESDQETMTALLSDIPDYCTVVFVFRTVELKIDGRQKKLKDALDQGLTVEFARQSPRELNTWIRRHFRAQGKDIGERECEFLSFVTGGSMTTLSGEIGKIAAYASGDVITQQDISAVVIPVLDAEVFDLTDAVASGDYETALQKLRTLLQLQQEPIPLLAALGSQMRRLLCARTAMNAGKGEAGLTELLKAATGRAPHPYVLQKTMTMARRVTDRFCTRAVTLCLEADARLKGFSGDDQRTLELLLLNLAQEVQRG